MRQRAFERHLVDEDAARDRHLDYYLDTLEERYRLFGTTSSEPLNRFVALDLDNLQTVHRWALESNRLDDDLRLYRPLHFFVNWHEANAPVEWARETLETSGIDACERRWDALLVADGSHWDVRTEPMIDTAERLYSFAARADGDAPHREAAFLAAVWLDSLGGNRKRAAQMWELVDLRDPNTRFLYWFIGPFARAISSDDVADTARQMLDEGLAWARSIGSLNFEAGLLQTKGEFEIIFGDPQLGYEIALRAERLAAAVGMSFAEAEAVRGQAIAALLGASTTESASEQFKRILQTASTRHIGSRAIFALNAAAHLLARRGEYEAAALAAHHVDESYPLPLEDINRVPKRFFEDASHRVEQGLGLFEIVQIAVAALDRIIANDQEAMANN